MVDYRLVCVGLHPVNYLSVTKQRCSSDDERTPFLMSNNILGGERLPKTLLHHCAAVTGYLMDVIGLKIGFFIFALLWSLIGMAHALAGGWISLAFLRGLMGLAPKRVQRFRPGLTAPNGFPTKARYCGGTFNIGTSLVRCWRGAAAGESHQAMLTFAD